MTDQRQYDVGAGTAHSSPVQHSGQSEAPAPASGSKAAGPEAVAGPFTLREAVIGGSVLVMFVGTILPFVDGVNLWRTFSLFFLGIGILLPIAALSLLVGRRLGAKSLRVGSLAVDQFASVAAAFAAAFFFLQTVTSFEIGAFIALIGSIGFLVATVGGPHLGIFKADFAGRPSSSAHPIAREALPATPRPPKPVPAEQVSGWKESGHAPASAAVTDGQSGAGYTVADHGPASADSSAPAQTAHTSPAHESATQQPEEPEQHGSAGVRTESQNPTVVVAASEAAGGPVQSAAPEPTVAQPKIDDSQQVPPSTSGAAGEFAHPHTESISATRDADDDEPVLEAFWFAVGTPRSVVDEQTGAPLFVLQPGDWEVGIEDRGHEFLVQDKRTGRVGVMRDLRNIERAPREG